jgi:hypothetical protein
MIRGRSDAFALLRHSTRAWVASQACYTCCRACIMHVHMVVLHHANLHAATVRSSASDACGYVLNIATSRWHQFASHSAAICTARLVISCHVAYVPFLSVKSSAGRSSQGVAFMYAGSVVLRTPCCQLATCNSASIWSYCRNDTSTAVYTVRQGDREVTLVASLACCLAAGTHDLVAVHRHRNKQPPAMDTDSVSFGCCTRHGPAASTYPKHPGYAIPAAVRPSVGHASARRGKAVAAVGPSVMRGAGSSCRAGECHRASVCLPAAAPACLSVTLQRTCSYLEHSYGDSDSYPIVILPRLAIMTLETLSNLKPWPQHL